GEEVVHRHQLHGGHAQFPQVVEDGGVGHAGVGAAQPFGDLGVAHGQSAHVGLVDHRLVVGDVGPLLVAPVEERADHHALGQVGGAVVVVDPGGVGEVVVEQRLVPVDPSVDGLGVGV